MGQSIQNPEKRPRPVFITTITENAPWVLISVAVAKSGVGEKEIRKKFSLRRFGNADYVRVADFNRWIETGESPPPAAGAGRKGGGES